MAEFDDKLNSILSDPAAMSQIMQLAQSLGSSGDTPPESETPPPSGGMDLGKLLPLIQEMGEDSNARALLFALRPYLKQERQDKVERAVQLARLFHLGKEFLSGWGKHV